MNWWNTFKPQIKIVTENQLDLVKFWSLLNLINLKFNKGE